MIILRCSIVAVIIFIPLTTIQHFIEPLSDCLLADICNHTWIPECAEDLNIPHKRLFIDECDIYEFNCDNNVKYLIVNYSDCFGPMTCPTLSPHKLLRQGNYLYRAGDRRIIYSPTVKSVVRTTLPMKTKGGLRRYTPEKAKRRLMKNKIRTTECSPCMRAKNALQQPPKTTKRPKRAKKHTTRRKAKYTRKGARRIFTSRLTTQVYETATTGLVVLRKMTVIKDGQVLVKVIKGFMTTAEKEDSDFLE